MPSNLSLADADPEGMRGMKQRVEGGLQAHMARFANYYTKA